MSKLSNNFNPAIGSQLTRRVRKGAISQRQADRTAHQRVTLAAIYGPNWRNRIYGEGGANGLANPIEVSYKRNQALKHALNVLQGTSNGGTSAPKGKKYLNG